jgi:hypothetical protein
MMTDEQNNPDLIYNFFQVKAHSADRFSFAHLEQCYALIEQYFLKTYGVHKVDIQPNKKWAEEFYQLVTAGEQKCANANCKM